MGNIYYVNNDGGSDGNTGLSPAQAFEHLTYAKTVIDWLGTKHGHTIRIMWSNVAYLASDSQTIGINSFQAGGTDFVTDPGIIVEGWPNVNGQYPTINCDLLGTGWATVQGATDYVTFRNLHFIQEDVDYMPIAFLLTSQLGPTLLEKLDFGGVGTWYGPEAIMIDNYEPGRLELEVRDCYFRCTPHPSSGMGIALIVLGEVKTIKFHDNVIVEASKVLHFEQDVTDPGEVCVSVFNNTIKGDYSAGATVDLFALFTDPNHRGLEGEFKFFNNIIDGVPTVFSCIYAPHTGGIFSWNNCYWGYTTMSDVICWMSHLNDYKNTLEPEYCNWSGYSWADCIGDFQMLGPDWRPTNPELLAGAYIDPIWPEADAPIGALPMCTVVPGGECNVCVPVNAEDYVVRTFELYMAKVGEPLVSVGSIKTGDFRELLDIGDVFGPDLSDPSPRLNVFRKGVEIDADIEAVTYQNISKLIGEDLINLVGGVQIDLTFGGLRPVYRIVLEYTFPNGTRDLIVFLHRACIESEFMLPFDVSSWSSIPVKIKSYADWTHDENPYGYILIGDNVQVS